MKIYLFCCSSSFEPAELMQSLNGHGADFTLVPLPCSGKVDILYLTRAFDTGADGAAVITCKTGDCRYLEGNLRAAKRVQAVDALLVEAGLEPGRTTVIQLGEGGIEQLRRDVEEFRKKIQALPVRAKQVRHV